MYVFLRCGAIKIAGVFCHGCKNIHLICLISVAVMYKDYYKPVRQIKLLTYFVTFWDKQQLIRCFIQGSSLNIYSCLDLFLHGSSLSFDNH